MKAAVQRRLRHLGVAAAIVGFVLSGCRDEPLEIPSKPKPPMAVGGEASGGEAPGNEGGAEPSTGGTAGDTSTAGTGATNPLGGNGGSPTTGGMGGMSGMGGKPPVNLNCGDGKPNEGEECDDGNKVSGDGCSAQCQSSCEACEKNVCPQWADDPVAEDRYTLCYDMPGKAGGGPAKGIELALLCHDLVDCVRREQCAQVLPSGRIEFRRCFCDRDLSNTDEKLACEAEATFVPGKCATQWQEASEHDTRGKAMRLEQAGGMKTALESAYDLLYQYCDAFICREECLSSNVEEPVALEISADILRTANQAGESALGNLIADATRSAGGTDFGFANPANYVGVGNATYVPPGLVFAATEFKAADADGRVLQTELEAIFGGYRPVTDRNGLPVDTEPLVTLKVTGEQIYQLLNTPDLLPHNYLYVSGLSYTWDAASPAASRVLEVRKGGAPISRAASYSVTADKMLVGSTVLKNGTDVVAQPDLLVGPTISKQFRTLPRPVAPPAIDRIIKVN